MPILIKSVVSVALVLAATSIGKKFPAAGGLIGVMPLAGAIVLFFMYFESRGDAGVMQQFTLGALWGILPSTLFYLTAFVCFRKNLPFPLILGSSFGVWAVAALVHQWLLK